MELPIPAWFKWRQCEVKPAGERVYEVTAPQMEPSFIRVRATDLGWQAAVADTADGPELAASRPDIKTEHDAWVAAFELFRNAKVN